MVIYISSQVIPATSLTLPLLGRYLLFSMVSFVPNLPNLPHQLKFKK